MIHKKLLSLIIITLFVSVKVLDAQIMYFWKVHDENYPTMKVEFSAKDFSGNNLYDTDNPPTTENFKLYENDQEMTFDIENPNLNWDKSKYPPVRIWMLLEQSNNTGDVYENKILLTWIKEGAMSVVDSVEYTVGSKVGFSSYARFYYPGRGFTTDTSSLSEGIHDMEVKGNSTSHYAAFGEAANTAMKNFDSEPEDIQRAVLMVTNDDGADLEMEDEEADKVIAWAIARKISIFVVTINYKTNFQLAYIARSTGGKDWRANTLADFIKYCREVVHIMQAKPRSYLVYQAPYGCDKASKNRNVFAEFYENTGGKLKDYSSSYTAPEESIAKITFDKSEIVFDKPGSGATQKTLTVTNNGPTMTIDTIMLDPMGTYRVTNWVGGQDVELTNGQQKTFNIDFVEEPPAELSDVTLSLISPDFLCTIDDVNLSVQWYSAEFTAEGVTFESTEYSRKTEETIEGCILKNTSTGPITVNVSVTDDAMNEFSIKTGGGDHTLQPDECIEGLVVEFAPQVNEESQRTAKIKFDVTDPSDFDDSGYEIALTGNALPSAVEEELIGIAGNNLKLTAEPNPATDLVNIKFELPENGDTKLDLYNSVGTHIESLVGKYLSDGTYQAVYSAAALPTGMYILKLQSGPFTQTLRLMITK